MKDFNIIIKYDDELEDLTITNENGESTHYIINMGSYDIIKAIENYIIEELKK